MRPLSKAHHTQFDDIYSVYENSVIRERENRKPERDIDRRVRLTRFICQFIAWCQSSLLLLQQLRHLSDEHIPRFEILRYGLCRTHARRRDAYQ